MYGMFYSASECFIVQHNCRSLLQAHAQLQSVAKKARAMQTTAARPKVNLKVDLSVPHSSHASVQSSAWGEEEASHAGVGISFQEQACPLRPGSAGRLLRLWGPT